MALVRDPLNFTQSDEEEEIPRIECLQGSRATPHFEQGINGRTETLLMAFSAPLHKTPVGATLQTPRAQKSQMQKFNTLEDPDCLRTRTQHRHRHPNRYIKFKRQNKLRR
jgi:hypothetical protein